MTNSPFKLAKEYALGLANTLTKVALTEFFMNIHDQFYPGTDITFMTYFLELTAHEDEFYVHHSKLRECGIMTSTESSTVKRKLELLDLVEGEDFTLDDIVERGKSGSQIHKHYHLTPKAFKKCLMRARKYANQPVDPVIYCNYYLLLEDVFKLYTDYERAYSERLLAMKDDKINVLLKKVDDQSTKIDIQSAEIKEQSAQIAELLMNSQKTLNKLEDVHGELVETRETVEVAKSYLEDKSFTSTMNPENEQLHHYFVATVISYDDQTIVKFVTGTKGYVEKQVTRHRTDSEGELAIEPFYNANGIDLRNNVFTAFKQCRRELIKEVNAANALSDKEFNDALKIEIREYNKVNSPKRVFSREKRITPKIGPKDIPVEFKKTKFTYTMNPYMSYDDIIKIVKDVHNITQQSPMKDDE